jgi:hypothetical protein
MLFAQTLGMTLDDLVLVEGLYLAEVDEVMAWLRTLPDDVREIMVFGQPMRARADRERAHLRNCLPSLRCGQMGRVGLQGQIALL